MTLGELKKFCELNKINDSAIICSVQSNNRIYVLSKDNLVVYDDAEIIEDGEVIFNGNKSVLVFNGC